MSETNSTPETSAELPEFAPETIEERRARWFPSDDGSSENSSAAEPSAPPARLTADELHDMFGYDTPAIVINTSLGVAGEAECAITADLQGDVHLPTVQLVIDKTASREDVLRALEETAETLRTSWNEVQVETDKVLRRLHLHYEIDAAMRDRQWQLRQALERGLMILKAKHGVEHPLYFEVEGALKYEVVSRWEVLKNMLDAYITQLEAASGLNSGELGELINRLQNYREYIQLKEPSAELLGAIDEALSSLDVEQMRKASQLAAEKYGDEAGLSLNEIPF